MLPILTQPIRFEQDVVSARRRARLIAQKMGFDTQDQIRIATAISEIVRNAFRYAGGGRITFSLNDSVRPQSLFVKVEDTGKGIQNLDEVLEGRYKSLTGMGLGLVGTRRLMDSFDLTTGAAGTTVTFSKTLSLRAPLIRTEDLRSIANAIANDDDDDPLQEIQKQNAELLRTLDELRLRQEELRHLNRELEDTNRGVVALYAELDEKADHLRRADEMKSKFLSNMSHEFRTPLNSMLALSRILLDRTDGELSSEQEIQVGFIRKSAQDLSELVDDLLDLAKVAAGKIQIMPRSFEVEQLFGALRGMLRPLLLNQNVQLIFEDATSTGSMYSDEGKVSQILRNLISNALKFTVVGEVRVRAYTIPDSVLIAFEVSDTGIGIAPENLETVFEEFIQVNTPQQRYVKGTGLGLPLSRKFAELLGGDLTVESKVGVGSVFRARLPRGFEEPIEPRVSPEYQIEPGRIAVMVIEDRDEELYLIERCLQNTRYQLYRFHTIDEARKAFDSMKPEVVLLDILLNSEDGWMYLRELKPSNQPAKTQVVVITMLEDRNRAMALGADAFFVKPLDGQEIVKKLDELIDRKQQKSALIIDDEEVSRYLTRQLLEEAHFRILEADSGAAGLHKARSERPDIIILDLVMPGMSGYEVLEELRTSKENATTPVIINTSSHLSEADQQHIRSHSAAILSKEVATHSDALDAMIRALEVATALTRQ